MNEKEFDNMSKNILKDAKQILKTYFPMGKNEFELIDKHPFHSDKTLKFDTIRKANDTLHIALFISIGNIDIENKKDSFSNAIIVKANPYMIDKLLDNIIISVAKYKEEKEK